jgi:hypothetical protein
MFYLEIKSTLVILWSIFIPLKINNAMNNIYQLVLISCAIQYPLTTTPKSEKFRFPKRVWSQRFRIRDCVHVLHSVSLCCFAVGPALPHFYEIVPRVKRNWTSSQELALLHTIYFKPRSTCTFDTALPPLTGSLPYPLFWDFPIWQ